MEQRIDLMIAGTQKAGTTSLKNYLIDHPGIFSHQETEFGYFTSKEFEQDYKKVWARYFAAASSDQLIVAKNVSLCYSEEWFERFHDHYPQCKVVMIFREPVERCISGYFMGVEDGWMKYPFNDIVTVLKNSDTEHMLYRLVIRFSLYAEQMRLIYKYFNKEDVMVLLYENLSRSPDMVCNRIYKWLGLESHESASYSVHNQTNEKRSKLLTGIIKNLRKESNPVKRAAKRVLPRRMYSNLGGKVVELNTSKKKVDQEVDEGTKEYLREYFRPLNTEFSELTGIDLSAWDS